MNFFKRSFYDSPPRLRGLVLIALAIFLFFTRHQVGAGRQVSLTIVDMLFMAIIAIALTAHVVRLVRYVSKNKKG